MSLRKKVGVAILVMAGVAVIGLATLWHRTARELDRLRASSGTAFKRPPDVIRSSIDAAQYARGMLWVPYDPLMGTHGDPFGKIGLVVCIDVPVRAYQAAGISIPALLKSATESNPDWFTIGPNNPPSSPFFYRRVRNYFPLFKNHPALLADMTPRVGDWAFYGKHHIALVTDVGPSGYDVIEASPRKFRVSRSAGVYMEATWGKPSFFGRLRQ